ncbi:MAG: carbohydrate ABC transporter substrate-binding protein, partial [Proteobacteria bacterium]|nr:carbohydrate ABC transporter substrate-binding protein [Pseudomonadota bacterium]
VVERGYAGTTATSHTAGAIITINPRFPKAQMLDALNQDIDGRKAKQPNVTVKVETFGAWTNTYLPDIDKVFASGTVGDLVWYPPRHRSHLLWGSRRNLVRDLTSQLRSMKFDLAQFFKASIDQNSDGGKLYFLPFISEPVCPIIAINRTAAESAGLTIPTDDWTFDDLAEWGQKAAGRGLFGYFRADSGVDATVSFGPFFQSGRRSHFRDAT